MAVDAEGNTYKIGETPVGDFVGDFDDKGNLWTFQSSVNRITKIDVDNLDANGDPVVVNYYLPNDLFADNTYDVAYNAAEDAFYAVKAPGQHGGNGEIIKIDVSNFDGTNEPVISKVDISGTLVAGEMQAGMAKGAYGAVFMDADGNVYAGLNKGDHDLDGSTDASGGIYKFEIDFETGQGYAELLSDAQSTGSNDGASDPRAVDPFAPKDTTSTILIKSPELVSGAGGNDDLRGGKGDDAIDAGAGDDNAYGGEGDDTIEGGSGNDNLFGNDGADLIKGGTGDDVIDGGAMGDTLEGGDGNDRITDMEGDNVVDGGRGNDEIRTGDGNDQISGGDGNDRMYSGDGNDTVSGGDGNDTVNAGDGADVIDGGAGQDFLLGGSGSGSGSGSGNDYISGGADTDKLVGGSGSDTLEGGAGTDHLWGGNWSADGASDTFVYSHGGGKDIVHDFETGHDQIDLSAYGLTYEDIQDRLIDRGWAVEINLEGIDMSDAGDKILLKSVKAEDLDADNFII